MISKSADILALECPITGDIVGLSKNPFPEIPYSIKKSHEYKHRKALLKKKGLKFKLKVFDVVQPEDVDTIYSMYLQLFNSWNYPLFNFKPIRISQLDYVLKSNQKLHTNKYMVDDLPYLIGHLKEISIHAKELKLKKEREIYFEMIFIIYYSITTDLKWSKLRWLSKLDEVNHPQMELSYNCFSQIIKTRSSIYIFDSVKEFEEPDLIRCLNYIFSKFQIKIVYNTYLLNNAFSIYSYLREFKDVESKLRILQERYSKMLDAEKDFYRTDNKLNIKEYHQLSTQLEEII